MNLYQATLIGPRPKAFKQSCDCGEEKRRDDPAQQEEPENHQFKRLPRLAGKFLAKWLWEPSENTDRVRGNRSLKFEQFRFRQDMACRCPARIDQPSALAIRNQIRYRSENQEQCANPDKFHAAASSGKWCFGSGISGKRVL